MQDTEGRRILLLALFLITVRDSLRHRGGGRSRRGRSRVVILHVGKEAKYMSATQNLNVHGTSQTYLNALEWEVFSRVGGVPVREEVAESSPRGPR